MPPTSGRCARPVARHTPSGRGPQSVGCVPDHARTAKRLEDLDEARALGDVPNRLCLWTSQHPHHANVAHGSRLGVHPKVVAGADDPLREPGVGEVEDGARVRGPGRDEVQRLGELVSPEGAIHSPSSL